MNEEKVQRLKELLTQHFPGCPIRSEELEDYTASFHVQCEDGNRVFWIKRKDLDDCPVDRLARLLDHHIIIKRLQTPWKRVSLSYGKIEETDI
ncbi:MAG: hypothetical protein ABSF90_19270 [Syntrophobacteraceae bacterium]|jgi:hypothetical protein